METGLTDARRQQEQHFLAEFRLALDDLRVSVWRPPQTGFGELSLARQVERIRELLQERPALAAVWLSQPSSKLLLLHLVSVSTGRALVRLVESAPRRGSVAKLALAARELLGTAYLFARPPGPRHAALARVVAAVRRQVAPPPPAVTRPWSVGIGGRFQVGVWGQTALTMGSGLGLDVEVGLGKGWMARLRLDALARPLGEVEHARVDGLGLEPGLDAGHAWAFGPSELLVTAGLRFAWNVIWLRPIQGTDLRTDWTELQLTLGVDWRWRLSKRLAFQVGIGLQATPNRHRFLFESSRQVLLATPWLTAGFTLGLRVLL